MQAASFRTASTALLTVIIVTTVASLAVASLAVVKRQNDVTQQLVGRVEAELVEARQQRAEADRVARRTLHLESQRVRLSILIEGCTVAKLQGQNLPRCRQVRGRARHLAEVIRDFRARLQAIRVSTPSAPGVVSGGTVTATATETASPSPHRGESDQCPENNPHC